MSAVSYKHALIDPWVDKLIRLNTQPFDWISVARLFVSAGSDSYASVDSWMDKFFA